MNSKEPTLSQAKTSACSHNELTDFSNIKIQSRHLQKLAYVYIRQSSLQQLANNKESTLNQYQLVHRAKALGWPKDRIIVIDDDLGKSGQHAENRGGFQKLLTELALDHVGIIIVIEMSRLARSCKDWYQLLEVCGIFGTLLADSDGIYDLTNYNDRLLLGLRGTMSEAELHVMRGRLWSGKLSKARRGELRNGHPPTGYIQTASGKIIFDPDEQVRSVIQIVFRKYRELGTIHGVLLYMTKNQIKVGIRNQSGEDKGLLEWRNPNQSLLTRMLHNPWYAGAYAFGRHKLDPKRHKPDKPRSGITSVEMKDWLVLIQNLFPAYISWEEFEHNQAHLTANAAKSKSPGAARNGAALLVGLLKCKKCGYRMTAAYGKNKTIFQYMCGTDYARRATPVCQHFSGKAIDSLVTREVLKAIEPASLDLSVEAVDLLEDDRREIDNNWKQKIERVRYESTRAERQYKLVDPENRLVAGSLERDWEKALTELREIEEDYQRFCRETPPKLTKDEILAIHRLSEDLPKIWNAETSLNKDRKAIIRQLIESIYAESKSGDDMLDVEIVWKGGHSTCYRICRSVGSYESKHDFEILKSRIITLRESGLTLEQIAKTLNTEGFRPASAEKFLGYNITELVQRFDLPRIANSMQKIALQTDEWLPSSLAVELGISYSTLLRWRKKGLINCRSIEGPRRRWVILADKSERERLRRLHQQLTQTRRRTKL